MKYGCSKCDAKFKTLGGVERHIGQKHGWCIKHNEAYGLTFDADGNYENNCGCFELDNDGVIVKVAC